MKNIDQRVKELLRKSASSLNREEKEQIVQNPLIKEEVSRERQRAVKLCRKRSKLWENTIGAQTDSPKIAREEARARYNEATYLADLIDLAVNNGDATVS